MSRATNPTIGIRDSGVGGLTVASRIRALLPAARLLYFADTAHVPYGERTPAEVRHYALSISQFLMDAGAELVVFACNTSSAYALELARSRFATPVLGMIEPGARAALQRKTNGPIGVLATQATVNSGMYTRALQGYESSVQCVEVGCPEFVPLVESEQEASPEAYAAARRYLQPLRAAGASTVILGCTHYPLLLPVLQEIAPELNFVDPAAAVADEVASHFAPLKATGNAHAGDIYYASGEGAGLGHWVAKLMPPQPAEYRAGPVFDLPSPPSRLNLSRKEFEHAAQ